MDNGHRNLHSQVWRAVTCTMRVAKMLLALMSPGIPRYWMPFLLKMVAPASNQGTWLVPFSVSGTTHPAKSTPKK